MKSADNTFDKHREGLNTICPLKPRTSLMEVTNSLMVTSVSVPTIWADK